MLKITEDDVRRLLPMKEAVRLMREAFAALRTGDGINQARRRLILPTGAVLHSMAGACGDYFGTKIYSSHPKHGAHFLFLLYHARTAEPLAQIEANWLGQIRTGAASAYATDLMARPDAATLAIIGSGFQARSQVEAMMAVRTLPTIRAWSRSADKRDAFSRECFDQLGVSVEPVDTCEAAVRGADIVVTATNAKDPVLDSDWIAPGTHINAMGSNVANRRELPADLVRAGLIVTDSLEQARLESGDLLMALDSDGWGKVLELKDVSAGYDPARITIFKSNGLGIEDVAAAAYIYEQVTA